MKKLALFLFFQIVYCAFLSAQVPGKMNYQAVIRNNDGDLITERTIDLKVSILNNTLDGEVLYTENHTKKTNAYGVVSIVIGSGNKESGSFSQINWGESEKYLGVKVDAGAGYVDMGTTQLLSVPYSFYSDASDSSRVAAMSYNSNTALFANEAAVANVLGSNAVYSPSSDTLFVVKDQQGNVVFAVFPDGAEVIVNETAKGKVGGFAVSGRSPSKADLDIFRITPDSARIYLNDTVNAKGKVGGFAVSGRSPSKGVSENILYVTADSTRVYVNDASTSKGKVGGFAVSGRSPSKGVNENILYVTADSTRVFVNEDTGVKGKVGGFAVSGRSPTKAETKDYFNISGSQSADIVNNEPRVMWYPKKSALLAGEVHVGSSDSVGTNSMAMGYRSIAMGEYSQAMGYKSFAKGDYSTAIGDSAIAGGVSSYALGNNANAIGESSFALGSGAVAYGKHSYAFGGPGQLYSFEIHDWVPFEAAKATADYSYALGMGCVSNNEGAVSFGTQDTASGEFATAFGYQTVASGNNSTVLGYGAVASGVRSFSAGFFSQATSTYSIAIGSGALASGGSAVALGSSTIASGNNSVALGGYLATAKGDYTYALGFQTIAKSHYETVIGMFNDTTFSNNMNTWVETDPIFIIGNGYYEAPTIYRKNAMLVKKNGEVYFPDVYSDTVQISQRDLFINSSGKIGYVSSSKRYKKDIELMKDISWLYNLKPVNFIYKNDNSGKIQYGLIAEEVELINKDFVSYNKEGIVETVTYSQLITPLLKALQDQNESIKKQQAEINELKSENEELKQKMNEIIELLGN